MIVRHFIRVPVGSTVYCDNQPVKILEKGYALALCDVNGKRVYITCYDLEKKGQRIFLVGKLSFKRIA